MTWIVIVSISVAVISIVVVISVILHTRWLYGKLVARHTSIAYLLAMKLSHNKRLMNRIQKLSKDKLPEFIEDLRELIAKDTETAPAMPEDSKDDREFILYLTLRILFVASNREELIEKLPEVLFLSPAILKAIRQQR